MSKISLNQSRINDCLDQLIDSELEPETMAALFSQKISGKEDFLTAKQRQACETFLELPKNERLKVRVEHLRYASENRIEEEEQFTIKLPRIPK